MIWFLSGLPQEMQFALGLIALVAIFSVYVLAANVRVWFNDRRKHGQYAKRYFTDGKW